MSGGRPALTGPRTEVIGGEELVALGEREPERPVPGRLVLDRAGDRAVGIAAVVEMTSACCSVTTSVSPEGLNETCVQPEPDWPSSGRDEPGIGVSSPRPLMMNPVTFWPVTKVPVHIGPPAFIT